MAKKKKARKKVVRRVERITYLGVLSSIFGLLYMSYFLNLAYFFVKDPEFNFLTILYGFSIIPLGLIFCIMGVAALKRLDLFGLTGIVSTFIGASAYGYIWLDILSVGTRK